MPESKVAIAAAVLMSLASAPALAKLPTHVSFSDPVVWKLMDKVSKSPTAKADMSGAWSACAQSVEALRRDYDYMLNGESKAQAEHRIRRQWRIRHAGYWEKEFDISKINAIYRSGATYGIIRTVLMGDCGHALKQSP